MILIRINISETSRSLKPLAFSLQLLILSATHIILKIEYKSRLRLKKENKMKMRLQFGTNLSYGIWEISELIKIFRIEFSFSFLMRIIAVNYLR
jgi:hypothetical protein